ncbi:nucleotide-binding universal stress UspA family protein [Arthrobacter sp. SLBN-100]|uniref:universal stress protein n=1 Tax=Arthrobacter sp. SLBN-100 TaxID=2768450 RepID=UPI00114E08C5|nr:universal stress protein [Arthrobacter sp. SLBN-100]TQJ66358.1 nucleotide-binding universal stress UspA family protein [Arthrobacter sp. SLBN-100]
MNKPIVVGVNGSGGSEAAMLWSLQRAARHKLSVIAVHALDDRWMSPEFTYQDVIRESGMQLLRQVQEDAAKKEPGVDVRIRLGEGSPASVLKDLSRDASMVVIGSHNRTWADGGPMTDRALQVVAASDCPVAVIPQDQGPAGRGVVVGVDGSEESLQAVALAAAEADREGDVLTAVLAFRRPSWWAQRGMPVRGLAEAIEEEDRIVLAESVAGLTDKYPDLVVRQRLENDEDPAKALVAAAADARLLVLGSRGRGGFSRLLLGSTAHAVLQRVPCPTVVTRLHAVKHQE